MLKPFLELLRIKHWLKNVFVLAPLFFSGKLLNPPSQLYSVLAFFAFSFAASSIYIFNDIIDLKADKLHPIKKARALASGKIKPVSAWIFLLFPLSAAVFLGLNISLAQGYGILIALLAYLVLNVFYTLCGKNVIILDAFCIALGFVLRIIGGCQGIGVKPSGWILVTTFFLSLFLGFGKRRNEFILLGGTGAQHRKVLNYYGISFLNQLITASGSIAILSYSLYTLDKDVIRQFGTEKLVYTVPFVVFGIFRYMFHLRKDEEGDPTEVVTKDQGLILSFILWALASGLVIYFK